MKKSCTGRGPCLSHQRRKLKARKNSDVRGCGRFLGGRTKGFGCVQSRGTQAGGGTLSHDINDDHRSGRTSRLSDQAVPGTPAGEGSPLCRAYEDPHHPPWKPSRRRSNRYRAACGRSKPPGSPARAPCPIGSRHVFRQINLRVVTS